MIPTPVPRVGNCPPRYTPQGDYFVPGPNAHPAILRNGTCPAGWMAHGTYCVSSKPNPKTVIPRSGKCPAGYVPQGNYFVET